MRQALTIFIVLSAFFIQAQDCNGLIQGLVEDNEGLELVGATIWIGSLQKGTVSQADGSFEIRNLCPGQYQMAIKYIGYEDAYITFRSPSSKRIVVKLKPSREILHDVVIEGEHLQQHTLSQSISILTEAELNATKGKPLGDLLKQVPGVSALMTGPSIFKPVIHGLHSQRILVLNNGIRQEGQQWGVEHAPEIDTYIASEIEVVKGAEAVRYGADALGGVVIINTPALYQNTGTGGEFHLGLMSNNRMGVFSGMLEGGFNNKSRWGWRLQTSIKKGGDYHAPQYNLTNTGAEELNFSGTLGFKKDDRSFELYVSSFNTEIGILRSAHTGNLDDLQESIENETPRYIEDFTYAINNPRQKINHQLLKLNASKSIGGIGTLKVQYGGQYNQRKEYDIRRGGRDNKPAVSLSLFSHVLDLSLDHRYGMITGSWGVNGTLKDNTNDPDTGISPMIPDYNQYAAGVFFLEKLRKNDWLLEAGGRFDHQYLEVLTFNEDNILVKPSFTFNYASGTIGASYYFNPKARLSTNLGLSIRPPHVSELYSSGLHHGTGSIEEGLMIGDGEVKTSGSLIKNEFSKKWISSFQYSVPSLVFDITAYANWIDNYVFLKPSGTRLTIRGYFPVFSYDQTDALLMGGDISMKWNANKIFSYNLKFSYLHVDQRSQNGKLPLIPPAQVENAITLKPFNAGKWKDLYFTVSIPTVFKQTRAPQTLSPAEAQQYTGDETFDFMPPPNGYTLINIEAGTKINLGTKEFAVILSAENILDTAYRNYMNRLRYYAGDTGRNLSIRLRYNFHDHK